MQPTTRLTGTQYRGEVVYLFAYDIAYELSDVTSTHLLGEKLSTFTVDTGKRSPREAFFYRARMVRLPRATRVGPHGPVEVETVVKVLSVGAISISIRVPFVVNQIEELISYHDLQFGEKSVAVEARELARKVQRELLPFCDKPVSELADEEAYTVFCIEAPLRTPTGEPIKGEAWLRGNSARVACLLMQETDAEQLARQEIRECTGRHLSYYEYDLVVIDWDAALVVDDPAHFEEIVYVMELANVQLAELEAYDRLLDTTLEMPHHDMRHLSWHRRAAVLRSLRELRIELTRIRDELLNITKFFGDWHLARIYRNVSARFHLADWHKIVDDKLGSIDSYYQLLQHDQTNRWMLTLEATIVLLFIVDVVLLVTGFGGK
ncbi:MAG: hypothetical protein N3G20_05600 [Verrucomicrobiae bacterium]|nr:hypothetical protein [Verrucomicrobiae bacterium]